MKKLFISQPMRGKTPDEIMAIRKKAIDSVRRNYSEEVEVIDSYLREDEYKVNPLWCLAHSLKLLSTADVAYFAKGWEDARGCVIEHECALQYGQDCGIDIIEDYTD